MDDQPEEKERERVTMRASATIRFNGIEATIQDYWPSGEGFWRCEDADWEKQLNLLTKRLIAEGRVSDPAEVFPTNFPIETARIVAQIVGGVIVREKPCQIEWNERPGAVA